MTTDRGLASGVFGLLAIVVVSALLFTLFDPAVEQVITTSSTQATHSTANSAINTRETIWNNILFYPLFVGAVFIIAKGVIESRRPG